MDQENLLWSLNVDPGKSHVCRLKDVRLTMASLDIFKDLKTAEKAPPQPLYAEINGKKSLLAALTYQRPSVPMDLLLPNQIDISFTTVGKFPVCLSGHVIDTVLENDFSDDDSDESGEAVPGRIKFSKAANGTDENDTDSSSESDFDIDSTLNSMMDESSRLDSNDEDTEDLRDDEVDSLDSSDDSDEEVAMPPSKKMKTGGKDKKNVLFGKNETPQSKKDGGTNGSAKSEKKGKKEKTGGTPSAATTTPKNKGDGGEKQSGKKDKTAGGNSTPGSSGIAVGKKQTMEGGVIMENLTEGSGPVAKNGKRVMVHYVARLKQNNKVFDKCESGPGFSFVMGKGEVIRGWEIGLTGMKMGAKRRITIPPNLAYGQKGCLPKVPPNSTLVFDVEMKQIK